MRIDDDIQCPKCGIIMSYNEADKIYSCLDPNCGYYEYEEEDDEDDEEEEDTDFHCPHCGKVIDEEELP